MFEEARSAMIKGDYLAAIAGFEAVLKVDPNYPNAANLLGVARGGAKNASQLAVDSGNKAEMGGDYAGASEAVRSGAAARSAVHRGRGRDAPAQGAHAERGRRHLQESEGSYDAMGRKQDAISAYEKALQLLPADHASAKIARERLAALKGGVGPALRRRHA